MKGARKKKKVLVIVAHPDDETIWMGGTLIKHKEDWETTIISLCRRDDKDRAPKFKKVCQILRAECFLSDLEDEKLNLINLDEIKRRIHNFIDDKKYDYIFTHGENGEYGHKRHRDVHKAVVEMLEQKMLSCEKMFFFSYLSAGDRCFPDKNADKFIKINSLTYLRKINIIKKIYGFNNKSFERKSCCDIESFRF